jgi:hypothetical protein
MVNELNLFYLYPNGQNIHLRQFPEKYHRVNSCRQPRAKRPNQKPGFVPPTATADNWPKPSAPTAGHANTYKWRETPYTFPVMAAMLAEGQPTLEAVARFFQRQGVL